MKPAEICAAAPRLRARARCRSTSSLPSPLHHLLPALLRAVTATLTPVFDGALGLKVAALALLACAFFLGFALWQLPPGRALDHYGPRRVQRVMHSVAVLGRVAFALSSALRGLFRARLFIGTGVSGCLMAPLSSWRGLFPTLAGAPLARPNGCSSST